MDQKMIIRNKGFQVQWWAHRCLMIISTHSLPPPIPTQRVIERTNGMQAQRSALWCLWLGCLEEKCVRDLNSLNATWFGLGVFSQASFAFFLPLYLFASSPIPSLSPPMGTVSGHRVAEIQGTPFVSFRAFYARTHALMNESVQQPPARGAEGIVALLGEVFPSPGWVTGDGENFPRVLVPGTEAQSLTILPQDSNKQLKMESPIQTGLGVEEASR